MAALRAMAAPTATALRDGDEAEIPAEHLVPGDVILLAAGDRVPADGRLFEAASLAVQEAALTGESVPVAKHTAALADPQLPLGDRRNMVFAGTSVATGRGRALVTGTGMATEFGRIAQMLQTVETGKTPLQINLDKLGVQLARAALVVVLIIVGLGLARGQPFIEMLVFGIALAVAVVPEALPAVVTISLALGVQRLVKRHALMRRLAAVETLGSTSVICSDKTGTLTRVKGDPTEGALVVVAAKAGLHKPSLDMEFPRVGEIPFDADTKRMTTLHSIDGRTVAYAKGAPEVIVAACALDEAARTAALEAARAMAEQALRVLALARRRDARRDQVEDGLTLLGLVGMIDPPRPEAKAAVEACERAGIRVVMITGDHPQTAAAVARELGLLKDGQVLTGTELDAMDDATFEREIARIAVLARVSPAHKLRAVTALQARGHVVAMTGDGVNDAPALKRADIGVAMGITGTDVAKEAAAMTLTDDNFASIVSAVEEGRGIFGNIKKYLMFLLSSNIGEIGLMAGTALLGLPLPLTAVQILYVNLATDGLPALALSVDPPERDLMQRPPRDPRTGIFTRTVVTLMLISGLWSALVNLGLFAWALNSGRDAAQAMTMAFVSLVLIQFFNAYCFRSDRLSVLHRPFANKWLNLAIAWELLLLAAVVYVPFLQGPFSTFSLTLDDAFVIVAAAATILPVMEIAKVAARRRQGTT